MPHSAIICRPNHFFLQIQVLATNLHATHHRYTSENPAKKRKEKAFSPKYETQKIIAHMEMKARVLKM
jgi:hypothetical protein